MDLWILLNAPRLHPIHLDTTLLNLYGENQDIDEDDAENVENNDNEPSKDSELPNSVSQTPDLNVVYKILEQKHITEK